MIVKVTFKNQYLVLKWSFILFILYTIFIVYKNHFIATISGYSFYLLFFIPELILHIRYYLQNKKKEYQITRNEIIIQPNNEPIVIRKEDIQGILLRKPANLQDGWDVHLAGITCYYYLKITLKSGEVYYFTNLLDPYIDKIFEENGYSFYREKGIAWL
jgi:hypothetical protein